MAFFKSKNTIDKNERLFSNKALVKIIIPLLLQQVLSVTVGTVDSVMVAHAGDAAVSGVSLVNTLDTLLIIFFTSMVGGGAVVISQALGRKRGDDVKEAAKQLIYIVTSISIVLTVTVIILRDPLLKLLFGEVEADVMNSARGYFLFVSMSFPLLAINECVGACFRASGNTRMNLMISIMINIVNVSGNAILIYGFEMGAKGAAIATLIARFSGTVIELILIHRKKYEIHVEKIFRYKPDISVIKRVMGIGIPNGIENAMFQFGRLMTQTLISTMGTAVIAANAVGLTVSGYQYMTGTACSAVMITVVGRCIGAGDEKQAKYYSRLILSLHYVIIWTVILLTVILLKPIISLYDLSDTSSEIARQLILYHAICAAMVWPIGFMLPSSFRAAGDVRYSMVVSMVTMWVFRVAGAYVCALETVSVFGLFEIRGLGLGIHGVWFAMTVDWLFRSTLFLIHYLRGKWLHAKLGGIKTAKEEVKA